MADLADYLDVLIDSEIEFDPVNIWGGNPPASILVGKYDGDKTRKVGGEMPRGVIGPSLSKDFLGNYRGLNAELQPFYEKNPEARYQVGCLLPIISESETRYSLTFFNKDDKRDFWKMDIYHFNGHLPKDIEYDEASFLNVAKGVNPLREQD